MQLSVLSWNVLADCHVRPSAYPTVSPPDLDAETRRRRVIAELQRRRTDLFLLQEVDSRLLHMLEEGLPDWTWARAERRGEGVAIGSAVGLDAWEAAPTGTKRGLVADLPGGPRVACVHLSWSGRPTSRRRPGLEQLGAVLDLEPQLVGGDFNALPDWPESARMRQAGFVAAGAPGATCNVNQWLQRIDEVWVRGRPLEAPPLPMIEPRTPLPGPVCASDHLPVQCRVAVEGGRSGRGLFSGSLF